MVTHLLIFGTVTSRAPKQVLYQPLNFDFIYGLMITVHSRNLEKFECLKKKKRKAIYLKLGANSGQAPLCSAKCRVCSALMARGRVVC
jgi:hypothetical protein